MWARQASFLCCSIQTAYYSGIRTRIVRVEVERVTGPIIFVSLKLKKFCNFLGGVRLLMYDSLPRPLLSKSGFQGCIASLETNGELLVMTLFK